MTKPSKVIKIEVPVAKFRRSRKDWDGHCHEAFCDGDPRPCEAPELCWPANCCFRDGTDEPLVARPTETVLMVPKSDLDSALGRIASREEALMKLSQFAHTAAHMSENDMRNNLSSIADELIALASRSEAPEAHEGDQPGFALAMRVLQSDLYHQLDDRERAECDALLPRRASAADPQGDKSHE